MKIEEIAQNLRIGVPKILEEIHGGNSFVFKGRLLDGTLLAIKEYKGDQTRIERMLSREESAIGFLRERGFQNVPEILEVRSDLGLIVYRWIEGDAPLANHESMSAIIGMCQSLDRLYTQEFNFETAIDAAFSTRDIETQIIARISRLMSAKSSASTIWPGVLLEEALHQYRDKYTLNQEFPRKTISISDLGTHNILLEKGLYNFIDFEFFGQDSVSKLVGDFLLHPRNKFDKVEIKRFVESIADQTQWDPSDLGAMMPILSLKWAAIAFGRTLNEMDTKAADATAEVFLAESNGIKYLRYFEFLISGQTSSEMSTFRLYADKI